MKVIRLVHMLVQLALILALTYVLASVWLASNWSEQLWTQLNGEIFSGTDPGLASDLELVLVVLSAFAISVVLVLALRHAFKALKRAA